jgi:predicted tellurium resistance membrane protein TerC
MIYLLQTWNDDWIQLCTLQGIISIVTLSVLEIVLGIDNIIFISITADKLPYKQQKKGRTIGLILALVIRCIMLFSISTIAHAVDPLFTIGPHFGVSGRALILFGGGIFLLIKTWKEIREKISGNENEIGPKVKKVSFTSIVFQIVLIDIVFSFDSILTAVGLSGNILIMVSAVVISMILMIFFSGIVSDFINKNPSIKMLALAFLIIIGGVLTAEAITDGLNAMIDIKGLTPEQAHEKQYHLNKNYAYFALAFALFIEILNMRERKKKIERNFGD